MTEADQEIVAGFATEYSGMRFGFFFFAEYVNVFVISAMMVVLFFGGWNAPFDWPFAGRPWPSTRRASGWGSSSPCALVPVLGTLVLALPFWLGSSRISTLQALVIGLHPLQRPGRRGGVRAGRSSASTGSPGSSGRWPRRYVFVFIFVQMRATFPRVRVDQLMGFAWKWLLPAALLNIFATAIAVSHRGQPVRSAAMSSVPGLGLLGDGAHHSAGSSSRRSRSATPRCPADIAVKYRGRLQLLYDEHGTLKCETCFQCAQACPIECIDMGGTDTKGRYAVHWGAAETYGERREESALRRSGREVPDATVHALRAGRLAAVDAILEAHDHDPHQMLSILEAVQAEFGAPPGRGAQADQPPDGRLVRDDLRHRHATTATSASSGPWRRSRSAAARPA